MRAIHAVRELNEERPAPIRLIALHTETERHALFVRQSDERHCIGPAAWTDAEERRSSAYLDYEALERARTPPGSAGASSPSTPSSRSCASGSASSSPGRTRG